MPTPEANKERIGRGVWECFHSFPYTLQALPAGEEMERGLRAYRAMVESVFRLYPCQSCRDHLQRWRELHLRQLDEAVERGRSRGPLGVVESLCVWAFKLHNSVTRRKLSERPGSVRVTPFLALEERGSLAEILHALSHRYNIVY